MKQGKSELITLFKMSLYKVKLDAKVHWGNIYMFEFEEYLRKEKNTIFEKPTIIWKILKVHWKIVLIGRCRGYEDEQ